MTDQDKLLLDAAKRYLPDGYVIVPAEPTEAMLNIGFKTCLDWGGPDDTTECASQVWRLMLAAAKD